MKALTIENILNADVKGFTSRDIATLAMDFVRDNEASDESRKVLRAACVITKTRSADETRKVASRKSSKKVFDQLVAFGMVQFPNLPTQPTPEVVVEAAPEADVPSTAKLSRMKKSDLIAMLQAMQA